jgi:hypothetical protein
MRTLTPLFSFAIASTLALSAQMPIPSNAMPPVTAAANSITNVGCVLGLNGGYSLNTDGGKTYLLAGEDLSQFSGQKVRAIGNVTPAAKSGSHRAQPTFTVTRVDKIADTCSGR